MQEELAHVAAVLLYIADALQQQAAGAAGPVADAHACFRLQHLGHEKTDLGGSVELAAGFARLTGEVADQVLIGVAEQVVGDVSTVEGLAAEVVDEVDQFVAGQLVLLVEVDLAGEDAVEIVLPVGVGPLDGEHGVVERLAELALGGAGNGVPVRRLRDDEMVVLRIAGQLQRLFLRQARLDQGIGLGADLFPITVVDALVEQQGEHIAAKLGMVGVAAQDVGGLVEITFQLALGHTAGGTHHNWFGKKSQLLKSVFHSTFTMFTRKTSRNNHPFDDEGNSGHSLSSSAEAGVSEMEPLLVCSIKTPAIVYPMSIDNLQHLFIFLIKITECLPLLSQDMSN